MALFDNSSQGQDLFDFGLDETGKAYLLETARWAKFLAVVGFVLLGLLILFGVFLSTIMGAVGSRYGGSFQNFGGVMMVLYVLIGILYFFPTYYLFKFSTLIKPALLTSNQHGFNSALSYLRSAFRYIGILTLVVLGLYALAFLVGIAGAAFG
jgi:hypothetical protein